MKGEAIPEDVLPHFMRTFEVLVKSNLSPEVMRSLSLFITYAFHVPNSSTSRISRTLSSVSRPATPVLMRRQTGDGSGASSPLPGVKYLTKKQLGIRVLSVYSIILCEKGNHNHIRKFAKTVTNKVRVAKGRKTIHSLLTFIPVASVSVSGERQGHSTTGRNNLGQAPGSPWLGLYFEIREQVSRLLDHGQPAKKILE